MCYICLMYYTRLNQHPLMTCLARYSHFHIEILATTKHDGTLRPRNAQSAPVACSRHTGRQLLACNRSSTCKPPVLQQLVAG